VDIAAQGLRLRNANRTVTDGDTRLQTMRGPGRTGRCLCHVVPERDTRVWSPRVSMRSVTRLPYHLVARPAPCWGDRAVKVSIAFGLAWLLGCGSPAGAPSGGGDGGVEDSRPAEAAAGDAASPDSDAAQGGGTCACGVGQICVHPSCGGGVAPACEMTNDAAACPAGWTYSPTCQFSGLSMTGPGCRPPPCVPPAPFCADIPASCGTNVNCGCLPSNVCSPAGGSTGGSCGAVDNGTDVVCGSA
jgi:hypothetical protein